VPYAMSIDHVRKRAAVVAQDPIDVEDALELMDRQVAGGAWTYPLLHDARQITWIPAANEIRRLVSHLEAITRAHGPCGPVAFIIANETLFGMCRMYSMLGESASWVAEVFRDSTEAERWLDDSMAGL
jgi:hypothetical protein